jgi:hypothetical protein
MRKGVIYVLGTITLQLSQTADGKPKVLILADDPYAITVELGSLKTPAVYSAASAKEIAVVQQPMLTAEQPSLPAERPDTPLCGIHNTPMTLVMKSKNGPFWSCHKRLDNGSWCSYRPR